jgi:hypothetical protein
MPPTREIDRLVVWDLVEMDGIIVGERRSDNVCEQLRQSDDRNSNRHGYTIAGTSIAGKWIRRSIFCKRDSIPGRSASGFRDGCPPAHDCYGVGAPANTKLGEQAVHVILDGGDLDAQLRCNLFIGKA